MSGLLITTEIVGAALRAFANKHDMELEDDDFRVAGHAAAHNLVFQVERHQFAAEVAADIASLDTPESVTQKSVPNHRPEFGL